MIWCRCVCGGWLFAREDSLAAKYVAVKQHNLSVSHRAWRWHHE